MANVKITFPFIQKMVCGQYLRVINCENKLLLLISLSFEYLPALQLHAVKQLLSFSSPTNLGNPPVLQMHVHLFSPDSAACKENSRSRNSHKR